MRPALRPPGAPPSRQARRTGATVAAGAPRRRAAATPLYSEDRSETARGVRLAVGAAGLVVAFGAWELAARTGIVNPVYLRPPSVVVARLGALLAEPVMWRHAGVTLLTIGWSILLAHLVALPLAFAAGRWRLLRHAVAPLVEIVRGLAPLALLPAFLLLFGIGLASKIAILTWVAWVPIFVNVLEGVDNVPPNLLRAARSMGAGPARLLRSVVLPSALPYYFAGLRLAIGAAFLAVVAAEMLGSNAGIGFFILEATETFRITDMYAAILLIGIVGLVLNQLVVLAGRPFREWRE